MRPPTPTEVSWTYVKGTLVNLRGDAATDSGGGLLDLRQGDTCKIDTPQIPESMQGYSRIPEVAMQDSNEEEHPIAAPPSF